MDLTRRGLIGRAAAATGALMGASLVVPRIVHAGEDGEMVFELPVRGRRVDAGREFELIAVDRSARGIEVRGLGVDGRWSEWIRVPDGHDHGPDPDVEPARDSNLDARPPRELNRDAGPARRGSALGRRLTDPVWIGPSRAFELRGRRLPRRALLVASGRTAAASSVRYVDTGLEAGAGQPRIVARSSWATASCRPRDTPSFGGVQLAFVHHTVSSNSYRASQAGRLVRSICLFHKYGNGWDDIGYNFVVDRYGQIFEGRLGGVDEAIVGAQAGGYNIYSTGVALLGYHAGAGPPRKAFDALARLLAWKLTLHGLAIRGSTSVRVTRRGAPYSRYRAGARVRLNRISGHRDGNTTECPGNAMYRQLPRLRQVAARLAGTPSALAIESVGSTPQAVHVGGRLTVDDVPLAAAAVELQRRSPRGATTIATATTSADGTWSVGAPLETSSPLRALFRGDGTANAVVSAGVFLEVPPQITLVSSAQQAATGSVIDFGGATAPVKPKVAIVVSKQQPDGTLTTLRTIRVNTEADGGFARSIGFTEPGQYQVIAHTAADDQNGLGTSPPVTITIA